MFAVRLQQLARVHFDREISNGPPIAVIYALLGMRFLLALLAARSTAGFVQFVVAVSNPFYAPFKGIVASPSTDQGHTLMLPIVVAIIAYVILHLLINGLLRMFAHRKTEI